MRGVRVRLKVFLTIRNLHLFLSTKVGKKAAFMRNKFIRNTLKLLAKEKKLLLSEKL